jgi:hypothetical protein
VTRCERIGDQLVVEFAAGFDRRALEDMLATEKECCPFFTFGFDDAQRRLTVGVSDAAQAPALEAVTRALGAG